MRTPSRNTAKKLDSPQRFDHKCVCQICTCGKHHCPKKHTKFQGDTCYHRDYIPHQISSAKQEKCKHHYQQRHYDPQLIKTSYDQFYTPYKIQSQNHKMKYQYHPRQAQFYDETQYKKNYDPKKIVIEDKKGHCHTHYIPNRGKFEGITSYTAQFTPKKTQTNNNYIPKTYDRRKIAFQGQTMYSTQYVPHKIEPNTMIDSKCRCSQYETRKARFEGQSRYRQDYKGYQIQHDERCPILDLPHYPRQCSPGKNHVNYSAQKNNWD